MALTPQERECPRQESHLRRELRRLAFSLLNYGDEMVRHVGAAPTSPRWKRGIFADDTSGARKRWLRPVSRRTLLVFSEALIYLSYTAVRQAQGLRQEWSLHEVTLLGRPVIGRVLCF